jgi:septal ring factor EnvC (AmiA/AmiB activator)
MTRGFVTALMGLSVLLSPLPVRGQDPDLQRQIRESQRRLAEIRNERERLQTEMSQIRNRVRNAALELQNIEQQLSSSLAGLAEVEFQSEVTSTQVQETTAELLLTREGLREGHAVLFRRVRDIYKRGPLHSLRVLLGAESFADLLSRYRYLQLVAAHDRALVDRITRLEEALDLTNQRLERRLAEWDRLRQTRLGEVAELRQVEMDRQAILTQYQHREEQTETRLAQLEDDESRLTGLLGDLERRRIEAEARRSVSGAGRGEPGSLSGTDAGSLDWPVEGELIYRFGRERRPNGTVLRWNGIGIRAQAGTPVRAVRSGTVALAGPLQGYGPSVVLSHGGGFYTLYLYLEDIGVVEGREVETGQVVGTVGGSSTPEGPHLEFQIRAPVGSGAPQAMDPLQWLRSRAPGL